MRNHLYFLFFLSQLNPLSAGNAAKFFHIVRQNESMIIERFGRFSRVLQPGIQFKIPFVEKARPAVWSKLVQEKDKFNHVPYVTSRIDLREQVSDLPSQSVITKDNVAMKISAIIYYQIIDPKKALYGIDDLPRGIEKLALTSLRNIIGSLHLDETLVSRDAINGKLCSTLDGATEKWGVNVTRVELQEVSPPREIQHAMEQQMTAERTRRAQITQAEGTKQAAILLAESERESSILRAEGKRTAQMLSAEGEANAIRELGKAQRHALEEIKAGIGTADPSSFVLSSKYIEAFSKILEGQNNKLVILPAEMSALSGLAAGYLSAGKAIIEPDISPSTHRLQDS